MTDPNDLQNKISQLRNELFDLANKNGITSNKVVAKSQELDRLILEEMKLRTQKVIRPSWPFYK